jgi:FHS family glucose/mannose:H+ symporter-like MFS transporter
MMSYVHRMRASTDVWAPIATSGFWMAILCGRVVAPQALRRLCEAQLFASSLIAAFTSALLLLVSHTPAAIAVFSTFAGLSLGPIYPLCLARVLSITHDSINAKWVFGSSGLGGALFPWITGQVSAHTGSLRTGLLVPVCVLGMMTILHQLEWAGRVVKVRRRKREGDIFLKAPIR